MKLFSLTKVGLLIGSIGLGACATEPGGFTSELKPVNVAGHTIHTVMASAWMKTCFGNPDQVTTMLSQFEHVHGDRYLTHIASGTTIGEGDCNALVDLFAKLGGAAIMAEGIRDGADVTTNNANASTSTVVDVDVNGSEK